jgi:hypothetical protein
MRLFRLISITTKASGYAVTFEDEDGERFETTATVTDHRGIELVNFDPDLTYRWNGTAESLRRIARIVRDFHAAHIRASPDE